mmetsp:Transcript_106767/g.278766  ORF Transcript_106767/g.278766 Transcript_106767/m.278766 type:complete len:291 (+) Transcript_106767:832-1704(+)
MLLRALVACIGCLGLESLTARHALQDLLVLGLFFVLLLALVRRWPRRPPRGLLGACFLSGRGLVSLVPLLAFRPLHGRLLRLRGFLFLVLLDSRVPLPAALGQAANSGHEVLPRRGSQLLVFLLHDPADLPIGRILRAVLVHLCKALDGDEVAPLPVELRHVLPRRISCPKRKVDHGLSVRGLRLLRGQRLESLSVHRVEAIVGVVELLEGPAAEQRPDSNLRSLRLPIDVLLSAEDLVPVSVVPGSLVRVLQSLVRLEDNLKALSRLFPLLGLRLVWMVLEGQLSVRRP